MPQNWVVSLHPTLLVLILIMPNGYSLHIGLNKVDNLSYQKKVSLLNSCHNDAVSYLKIASNQGFYHTKMLLDDRATSTNFYLEIKQICDQIQAGDLFLLTFSGHGSQRPSSTEEDGQDETWCFYDGQVLDDQLFELWLRFKKGVRILVISDSCHSGTILRDIFNQDPFAAKAASFTNGPLSRSLEIDPFTSPIKAHVKLLAAAKEDRYADNSGRHGAFTQELLNVWADGTFEGHYKSFFDAICKKIPATKPPVHMDLGTINEDFNQQKPFQINF